jgi:hypothetical protein
MKRAIFSYVLLYVGGTGFSPAETIAANFPQVIVELGQYRGKSDGRFVAVIEAKTMREIDDCLAALGAFGAQKLSDDAAKELLSRNLPKDTKISVADSNIKVTFPKVE